MNRSIGILIATIALVVLTLFVVIYNLDDVYETYEFKEDELVDDVVTIRFMSSWAGVDTKTEKLERVIESFELKYPNIDIVDESIAGEDFLFHLKTDFASANEPDIFGLWPGTVNQNLIDNGLVADISSEFDDEFLKDLYTDAIFDISFQNQAVFDVPFEVIYEGLVINTDLFSQYNVKEPETYDELLVAVEIFSRNDIVPIAYNVTPEGSYIYQNIVMKLGGKEDTENPYDENGNIKANFTDAMEIMKELYEKDAFPDNAFTMDDVSRNDLFLNKKAAMIVQGSWFLSEDMKDTKMIPFPTFENGKAKDKSIIYGLGNGNFHISQKAWDQPEKREAAILFMKHLISSESREIFMELPGFLTGFKMDEGVEVPLIIEAGELVGPTDHYIDRTFWEEVLVKSFPMVLKGEIGPAEVFDMEVK